MADNGEVVGFNLSGDKTDKLCPSEEAIYLLPIRSSGTQKYKLDYNEYYFDVENMQLFPFD